MKTIKYTVQVECGDQRAEIQIDAPLNTLDGCTHYTSETFRVFGDNVFTEGCKIISATPTK